ncbi:glycosyltransferase family 2 protein [Flavobacterium sp.]|uniref:glycosyltransferase family 2 protein n=1 Tax=Flavobacterium sp. TaxID=239 RepID=UPI003751D7E3
MLSILIPTYNYETTTLVKELNKQAILEDIEFEIIVGDDKSTDLEIIKNNQEINSIQRCSYYVNIENLGRACNRNELVKKAKFEWILFLDCDVLPKDSNFIHNYIHCLKSNKERIYFGGLIYDLKKPKHDEMLRWIYGHKRESVILEKRKLKPYETTLTSNIFIKKEVLITYPFHAEIKNYGFEDLVFILELRKNKIAINHIDNSVYHLNLEKSIIFIEKFESSLRNLKHLTDSKIIKPKDARFSKLYNKLNKFKLTIFLSSSFKFLKPYYLKNLTSQNPSIYIFNLYRLSYFCEIKSK